MLEKQNIKGRNVWVKVDTYHVQRSNPNVIPTEYFTATFFLDDPYSNNNGETIKDEEGELKLFESPVAALSFAWKKLEQKV